MQVTDVLFGNGTAALSTGQDRKVFYDAEAIDRSFKSYPAECSVLEVCSWDCRTQQLVSECMAGVGGIMCVAALNRYETGDDLSVVITG